MEYCENWEKIQERFLAFWARENHDRPLIWVQAPKSNGTPSPERHHGTLKERWMDTDFIIKQGNWAMQNTCYGGESFPMLWPNLGPDIFGGLYGTDVQFGETTSWAVPFLTDEAVEQKPHFELQPQCELYRKLREMTAAIVEDAKGKYIAGITDIHPGADGLVSMRGPERLCCDAVDCPEFIQHGTMDLFDGFRTLFEEQYAMTTKYQRGCSNWMGIWHPGKFYVPSCDFSCMISTQMYEDLIVKEIEAEVEYLDASFYHLDGPGALKHLDRILQIEKLGGVQWVYGAGQPTASHWLPVLQKIQRAGKCFQVNVEPGELEFMLDHVAPEGAMFMVPAQNEEDVQEVMRLANQVRHYESVI